MSRVVVAVAAVGLPAQAEAQTLQLERAKLAGPAKVVAERAAGGGRAVALSARGTLRRRFAAPRAISALVLRARALPCGGPKPRVLMLLDGRRLGARPVRSRRFRSVRFGASRQAGLHRVTLRLANPGRARSCRRTVVVDSLRIVRRRAPLPVPQPSSQPVVQAPAAGAGPQPTAASLPPPPPGGGYVNPVFADPGAPDPGVLDVGGSHSQYFVFSTGDRFPMLRSTDLVHWTTAGRALSRRPSWAAPTGDWNPWAPSVIERAGSCPGSTGPRCFLLFHVARHATLTPATNCIGVAVSPVPEGPYREVGPLAFTGGGVDASGRPPGCGDDGGYSNIDPAPFVDGDGKAYLYLSTGHRCEAPAPGATCPWDRTISVIPLAPDLLSAAGPRQPLFDASDSIWEAGSFGPVVENPWPVRTASGYLLLYSGGAYTGAYGMGYATSGWPTGPFVKSADNPVLREAAGVFSPGGGMLATGPGGGTWLVYHGRRVNRTNPRELRIDRLRFVTDWTVAVDGPTSERQPVAP